MLYSRRFGHHRDSGREKEALKSRIGILQSYPEAMDAASDLTNECGKNLGEGQQKSALPRVIFDITKSGYPTGTIRNWGSGPHIKREDGEWDPLTAEDDGKEQGPFGPIYRRFYHKPDAAIEFLLRKRDGEAVAAIHKDGIGDIDFVWDDPEKKGKAGLRHILERRSIPPGDKASAIEAIKKIPGVIERGILYHDPKSRGAILIYDPLSGFVAVIQRTAAKQNKRWLVTSYEPAEGRLKEIIAGGTADKLSPDAGKGESADFSDSSPTKEYGTNSNESQQKSSLPRVIYEASPTLTEKDKPGSESTDLPPTPGTIRRNSPGSHLVGKSESKKKAIKRKQKTSSPYQIQKAGLVPKMCEYCREWEASQPILRVFASYAEFARSEFYAGGDLMQNDPYAEYAVWPGKTNANRHYSDWWICTPVHPNCNHSYQSWEPPDEEDYDFSEHFADLDRRMAERQQKAEEEYYGKSRIAPMEVRGVWHERTCACEDPAHDDRPSWVREYIARRFPVVVG